MTVFGTKEWASHNVNCVIGCTHDCIYCYAKYNAVERFKTVKPGEWTKEVIDNKAVEKTYPSYKGTVMFPTQHDITPTNLSACKTVIQKLLMVRNNVLIVSKPHLDCIKSLCDEFGIYRDQILFRFTICASDNTILKYWEPNAPSFEERMEALKYASSFSFQTSISMEPCLDWPNVVKNFYTFVPYVSNSIWIGTLNFIDQRVEITTKEDEKMVKQMKEWMSQKTFEDVYEQLKDHPLVRWKESMKKSLGLPEVKEIGQDI